MNTLNTTLLNLQAQGIEFIYAPSDSDANNGLEWLITNGYTARTREEALAAISSERATMGASNRNSEWVWGVSEELNSTSAQL